MSLPQQEETRPGLGRVPEQAATTTTGTKDTNQAGDPLAADLVRVVRLRREAREHSTQRQRRDSRAALRRTTTRRLTADEIKVQRDTAVLYARLVRLTKTGKIRWDEHASTWVERPTVRPTRHRPAVYTEDELLAHFERVRRNGKRWTARCPAHDDWTPSLAIAAGSKGWLVKCWAGCDFTSILAAADLDARKMFNR